ncbi:MAG: DUF3592 domain-containing protein [Kofleriaceae bacterium]
MLRAPRPRRRLSMGGLVFGVVLILLGVGMIYGVVVRPMLRVRAARSWTPTTCTITESRVIEGRDSDGDPTYRLRLRYRHALPDGRAVIGWRYDFRPDGDGGGGRAGFEALVARLPKGARTPCWYDPAEPRDVVLVRDSGVSPWSLLALGFIVGGLVLLRNELRRPGQPRHRHAEPGVWTVRQRGSELVLGAVLAFFAACLLAPWLGMFGSVRGLASWAIFVGWGALAAVMIGTALYHLGAYLVRVDLEVRADELAPGRPVSVAWRIRAPTWINVAHTTLRVRERVVVSEGEDTTFHDHLLHEGVLVPPSGARVGATTLALPAHLPPAQPLGEGRIEWAIVVRADLALWPDVTITLPLPVEGVPLDDAALAVTPAEVAAGDVTLAVERTEVAPGARLRGTVAWDRAAAPDGQLRLGWRVAGKVARSEVTGEVVLAELPRVPRADGGGPYRGLPADERAPLAARDQRRFELTVPTAPWSYAGEHMRLTWHLVAQVDHDVLELPLSLGPGAHAAPEPPATPSAATSDGRAGSRRRRGRPGGPRRSPTR